MNEQQAPGPRSGPASHTQHAQVGRLFEASAVPRVGRDRPIGGFELWSWLFMRISGLLLVVLAVGHVLIMHVVDEGVDRVNASFIAQRWASPFWRTWDWALLVLALVHGVTGLRVIVLDYVRRPGVRFACNMFFYTLGFMLFILGTVTVFTFDAPS